MPTIGNIAQHIGPMTIGTVMETNPTFSTTLGYMKNMGASDGYQFGTLVYTTTTAGSSLGYTPTNSAGPAGIIVVPAGSYIDNINVDVTVQFNAGTNNTITIAVGPTVGTTGTTIMTITGTAGVIGVGRYTIGITIGSAVTAFPAAGVPYLVNVSNGQTTPTDQVVQAWFTGTGSGATTGTCTIGVDYCVRNPDGSWYQQSPTYPITNPPVITY